MRSRSTKASRSPAHNKGRSRSIRSRKCPSGTASLPPKEGTPSAHRPPARKASRREIHHARHRRGWRHRLPRLADRVGDRHDLHTFSIDVCPDQGRASTIGMRRFPAPMSAPTALPVSPVAGPANSCGRSGRADRHPLDAGTDHLARRGRGHRGQRHRTDDGG